MFCNSYQTEFLLDVLSVRQQIARNFPSLAIYVLQTMAGPGERGFNLGISDSEYELSYISALAVASYPGPAQLSVAISTEKRRKAGRGVGTRLHLPQAARAFVPVAMHRVN